MAKTKNADVHLTENILIALIDDITTLNAVMKRIGIHFAALAKEHGIVIPKQDHVGSLVD